MDLTYRDLLKYLKELEAEGNSDVLDQSVSIYDADIDEVYPVDTFEVVEEKDELSDVLDAGSVIIVIKRPTEG